MRRRNNGFLGGVTLAVAASPLVLAACSTGSSGEAGRATTGVGGPASTAGAPGEAAQTWGPEPGYARTKFSNPTKVDNRWFPLMPGTQLTYEGETVEENGERIPHRVGFTVTDLRKVIDGVRTVVVWDRDYSAGQLTETELAFFAQADDGNVWHFGQYPEEHEDGKFVAAPAWIHGVKGAQAGITIKAEPTVGAPSYSQGWGPEVNWTDRARVHQVGQRTCVPAGCHENVLVTDETSKEEPGAHQYKYYAPGVGNVRVGFGGNDPTKETLELVKATRLDAQALAQVRAEALKLEKHAYTVSRDVYGRTAPSQPAPPPSTALTCRDNASQFVHAVRTRVDPDGNELYGVDDVSLVRLGKLALKQPSVLEATSLVPFQRTRFVRTANQWLCP